MTEQEFMDELERATLEYSTRMVKTREIKVQIGKGEDSRVVKSQVRVIEDLADVLKLVFDLGVGTPPVVKVDPKTKKESTSLGDGMIRHLNSSLDLEMRGKVTAIYTQPLTVQRKENLMVDWFVVQMKANPATLAEFLELSSQPDGKMVGFARHEDEILAWARAEGKIPS